MLKKPKYGWTTVKIGEFNSRASYLTDIPTDCLDACIDTIKNKKSLCIFFDAEGWDFEINSDLEKTIIITDDEDGCSGVAKEDIVCLDLIMEIVSDIEGAINEWSEWDSITENDAAQKKIELQKKINIIKQLLINEGEFF